MAIPQSVPPQAKVPKHALVILNTMLWRPSLTICKAHIVYVALHKMSYSGPFEVNK
jgi:hypothetical protein